MERWYYNYNGVLVHHGIKGQEWGVRNGPPYPLSRQKGGSKKGVDKRKASSDNRSSKGNGSAKNFVRNAGSSKVGELDDASKTAIAQLAVFAALAATMHIAAKAAEKRAMKQNAEYIDQRNERKTIKSLSDAPKLDEPMDAAESMKITNPNYPETGYTMNCAFCTTAMALREKGYDVEASDLANGLYPKDFFPKAFKGATVTNFSKKVNANTFLSEIEKNGPDAYGHLSLSWYGGGGHSVFWKVDKSGKAHIYDGQNGMEYTKNDSTLRTILSSVNMKSKNTFMIRLDNCEATDYATVAVEPRTNKSNDKKENE